MKLKSFIILVFAFCLFQPQMIEAEKKRPVKKTTNVNLTNFIYDYDNYARLKESEFLNNGKIFTKSKYNYKDDRYGNWIERKTYTSMPEVNPDDWSISEIIYREITYYE